MRRSKARYYNEGHRVSWRGEIASRRALSLRTGGAFTIDLEVKDQAPDQALSFARNHGAVSIPAQLDGSWLAIHTFLSAAS
jgi:hypothetical protein